MAVSVDPVQAEGSEVNDRSVIRHYRCYGVIPAIFGLDDRVVDTIHSLSQPQHYNIFTEIKK